MLGDGVAEPGRTIRAGAGAEVLGADGCVDRANTRMMGFTYTGPADSDATSEDPPDCPPEVATWAALTA